MSLEFLAAQVRFAELLAAAAAERQVAIARRRRRREKQSPTSAVRHPFVPSQRDQGDLPCEVRV